jgi:endonuclease/exonuclease/phosphatase family metal-dependent hydrolase
MVLLVSHAAIAATTTSIKVMTYNTHHGGKAQSPATTDNQLDTIAAENPDVVVLQEASASQLSEYINGLNARMGTTAWHGGYSQHCKAGTEPNCTSYSSEATMVLTRLKTVAVTSRLIWAKDDYSVARGTVRMSVALTDGTQVNVFSVHLPAYIAYRSSRVTYVTTLTNWAKSFSGAKLIGGDFNDRPGTSPIVAMTQQYADAWALGGSGTGYTHLQDGHTTPYRRIDYWFSDKASQTALTAVKVVGRATDSDHLGIVATYAIPSTAPSAPSEPLGPSAPSAPSETTLLHDGFDTFDSGRWPAGVITGSGDATVPVTLAAGLLRIGDLKDTTSGSHYNGISSDIYDLSTNGCASVQLVSTPDLASTAYTMFAVARDSSNYYRWYQAGGALVAEQRIGGSKKTLLNLQYDGTQHQFLRIRRVANVATGTKDVVFETAPNNGGVPGTFTERYRDTWSSAVTPTSLKFELKAGTSASETAPGSAYWDNFHAATSCR